MKAAWFSEMLVSYHITAWCNNPEDHNLNLLCFGNHKSHRIVVSFSFFRISPKNNVIAVDCKQYVEMLAGNVLSPYSFIAVSLAVKIIFINNYCLF